MSIKAKQQRIWGNHDVVGITFEIAAAWLRLRRNGFPHYNLSEAERAKELLALVKYGPAPIVAGENGQSEIAQSMHAQGFFWSYHPHAWEVRCGDALTPMEVFLDDEKLWNALGKRANHGSVNSLTDSEVRKGLKAVSRAQGVSGFRPSAAWAVYDRYCPYNATVYDPSAGWGGRLIGAFMCEEIKRYVCCEPSAKTFAGLMKMEADLRWTAPSRGLEIELHQRGSEGFHLLAPGSVDLCFTSPPYFSDDGIIEDYADEATQSHVRFPDYESWLEGFLGQTIRNCYEALKPGGILALNVSDDLAEAVTDQAVKNGFVRIETLRLRLSKIMGSKHKPSGPWKTEPVLVFRKPDPVATRRHRRACRSREGRTDVSPKRRLAKQAASGSKSAADEDIATHKGEK